MHLKSLIQQIRDTLYATQDTVCLERARLVTGAYQQYDLLPVPFKRAKSLAHILDNMTLDLDTNPIFAGNTSTRPRAWMLLPEYGFGADAQILLENDGLDGLLDDAIPQDLRQYWQTRSFGGHCGIGHLAVNLDRIVNEGLYSIIDEARAHSEQGDPAARSYRQAMIVALQAVIDWANRYAGAAEKKAAAAPDPTLQQLHRRVAEACRRVPAQPARTLFEGLQAIVLVHLAIAIEGHGLSISLALLDRVLEPFVDDTLDPDQATDLIAAFMLKITANSYQGRGSKTQPITVGGADHLGRDQCNALTRCFLSACDFVRVGDPHLFLRWHPGMDPVVTEQAADMLARGVSMPLLINDVPTAQGFIDTGCTSEDAWEYSVIGCNELGIPGRAAESSTATSGMVQHLEILNTILLEHSAPDEIADMDHLLALIEQHMRERLTQSRAAWQKRRQLVAGRAPTPFTSALMDGCAVRGQDMTVGMKYHTPSLYERGVSNGADALAAIENLVFVEQTMSMSDLVAEMRADFANPAARQRLLAAPKWGNDNDRVDHWALALLDIRERVLDAVDAEFGHATHTVCHVVRSLHYLDGQRIAASPDGRHAWTPVSDSIGAPGGATPSGPTAILNSVLKIDAARYYRGGYNLNLTLPALSTTPDLVRALVDGFFSKGGQELQINCFDASVLREAQQHPEQYGDMVVRIAGFSARFVDLSRMEQDELIARADSV